MSGNMMNDEIKIGQIRQYPSGNKVEVVRGADGVITGRYIEIASAAAAGGCGVGEQADLYGSSLVTEAPAQKSALRPRVGDRFYVPWCHRLLEIKAIDPIHGSVTTAIVAGTGTIGQREEWPYFSKEFLELGGIWRDDMPPRITPAPQVKPAAPKPAPVAPARPDPVKCDLCAKPGVFPTRVMCLASGVPERVWACDGCFLVHEAVVARNTQGIRYPWLDKAPAGCIEVPVDASAAARGAWDHPRGAPVPTRDAALVGGWNRKVPRGR